jgi:diguanylate cyclase (GGDEF)-like protein
VIEISDDSVAKIGQWPWARSWHATLIKILKEAGARAVVFDVIFSEASKPNEDAALAEAIRSAGNVYLAEVIEESPAAGRTKLLSSLPEFRQGTKGGGHINLRPDIDGAMRRIELVSKVDGRPVPQLSFQVALDEMGAELKDVSVEKGRLVIPQAGGAALEVPVDRNGYFILNWSGRWSTTYRHYSYVDLIASYAAAQKGLTPHVRLEELKGTICYVGTSATGLFDIRPTPLEPAYPAVGVNLTVLNNLLEGKFIRPLSYAQDLGILVLLMFALFPIMQMRNYFRTAVCTITLAAVYVVAATAAFVWFDVWVNIIYALALVLSIYFFISIYDQLVVTIERARLLKLATRDALTGLYNIGHFKLLFKAELATVAVRREKKLSIVMSDVDNFKKTNDTYGHQTGDVVLREVAAAFRDNCRALDVAARYGGEEMILMLPGASAEEAAKVADKIRKVIAEKVFPHEKGSFSTSVSMGVSQIVPDDKEIEQPIERADKALYEAKHTGKNKVMIAPSPGEKKAQN